MSLSLHHSAVAIILLAGVALAAAAQTGRGSRAGMNMSSMVETAGSAGGNERATADLALSDEQRGLVYEGVMRMPGVPVAHEPAPEAANALPDEVVMQDLPMSLAQDIPLVQGHKFVKFDDRIVVVEPASRAVVALIPRYRLLP